MAESTSDWRLSYVSELDGLRAFAAMAVVFAHGNVTGFKGGSFGVDVFFVLSGFLITSLLAGEIAKTGSVDLVRFWWKRIVRLVPALVVMVAFFVVVEPWLEGPSRSVAWAPLLYVSNWVSYSGVHVGVFTHTWSLAIEEQFYLVWPLVLLGLWRLSGSLRVARTFAIVSAVGVVIARAALVADGMPVDRWYFHSVLRADGIMMGCALGLWYCTSGAPRWVRAERLPTLAVTLIVGMWLLNYRGVTFLESNRAVIGVATLMLIGAAVTQPSGAMSRVLGHPVALWLGARSYAIYLWHYPLYYTTVLRTQDTVWVLGLTLLAADLSYRFVEQPIVRRYRDRVAASGVTTMPVGHHTG